jgi:hypothetical protein
LTANRQQLLPALASNPTQALNSLQQGSYRIITFIFIFQLVIEIYRPSLFSRNETHLHEVGASLMPGKQLGQTPVYGCIREGEINCVEIASNIAAAAPLRRWRRSGPDI